MKDGKIFGNTLTGMTRVPPILFGIATPAAKQMLQCMGGFPYA
ncbi:hypothetical protein PQQ73_03720 [Paraburkholderia strydomiana]|jgi:hypothetical protein|uniref:Uncharacterized protein n=1 Tax=Paraburkholderia strydomiana TaxID=1245417 RepID=A0ABW9E8V9_9BURK